MRSTLSLAIALAVLPAVLPAQEKPQAPAAPLADPGLVQVVVTQQRPDPFLPWQNAQPRERRGYGVLLDGTHVLTVEGIVRNERLVELLRPRSGEKNPAAVVTADIQLDLALLSVSNAMDTAGVQILAPAAALARDAQVQIVQMDGNGELQRIAAAVIRIGMDDLPEAPYRSLTFTLQTDSEINGQGAPVLCNGALAGLVVAYDRAARTASMVAYPDITRFVAEAPKPGYLGPATAGFFRDSLIDPAKRDWLGVKRPGLGVLVRSCLPGTSTADTLKPNDVILEWDGQAIDNLGFYVDPEFGRMDFAHLIKGRRRPGDVVPVTIVRDRKETSVNVKLCGRTDEQALIPEDTELRRRSYIVEGGFVLRELTGSYMKSYGPDWMRSVDTRLVHLYLTRQYNPSAPGERVVILAGVLADPVNIGYQDLRHEIVTAVNGKPVHNLNDLFRIMESDGHLSRFTFLGIGVDIVLDAGELDAANARLAQAYGITRLLFKDDGETAPATK